MKKEIAAIGRSHRFSPNMVEKDDGIFSAVIEQLKLRGYDVVLMDEKKFREHGCDQSLIMNMCREPESIHKLQVLERSGAYVVNSGFGIENCFKSNLNRKFLSEGIPMPHEIVIDLTDDTERKIKDLAVKEYWVKRGDGHTVLKEDVVFCHTPEKVQKTLESFQDRGITDVVLSEHLKGDLVKFYGVGGSPFFYWYYPSFEGSKFGYEEINGVARKYSFDIDAFKRLINQAAAVLNLRVYGGDAIIGREGEIKIIDFNDWPSFSPCKEEAARAIALCVINEFEQHCYKAEK